MIQESHIGQDVFKITQHYNCGIFYNYENSNWIQAKPDQSIDQGDRDILVNNRRKRRGDDVLKPVRKKGERME